MRQLPFLEATEIVKSALDVVDIVSRHVVLKKAGRNYLGLCPFHPEKSPSFNVNREKNLYKCFGCGEAGDALGFLMKRENKTFGEVIRDLAGEQGIEIISDGKPAGEAGASQADLKQKIFTLNEKTHQWFCRQLNGPGGEAAMAYLKNRGINDAFIQQFGLGAAPASWEALTQFLRHDVRELQTQPDLLVTAGLSNPRMEGQGLYDRFRNRLIIPIHDEQGRVVAFGGRALSDEDKPKYLNSPETPVYQKNRVLFGLYQAKEAIRQSHFAIVMEGYFDVLSAHWAGIQQAVGVCGTALSESHLKLLSRFGAETVYLGFDADQAGQKAALGALAILEPYLHSATLSVKILLIPSGKDPDEYIRLHGGEAFQSLLSQAQSYLDFKIAMALQGIALSTSEGRVKGAGEVAPILSGINQPILRTEMIQKVADQLGVSPESLSLEVRRYEQSRGIVRTGYGTSLQKFSKKQAISKNPRHSFKRNTPSLLESGVMLAKRLEPKHLAAERSLLRLLLLNTEGYQWMVHNLESFTFSHPVYQRVWENARAFSASVRTVEEFIQSLSSQWGEDSEVQRLVADLTFTSETFLEELGLQGSPSTAIQQKIEKEAEHYQAIIEEARQRDGLKQLAHQVQNLEKVSRPLEEDEAGEQDASLLALQYQLREKLLSNRNRYCGKEP